MRNLAILAAALTLGACAADSGEPEGAPAPPACIRSETAAGRKIESIWKEGNIGGTDDWQKVNTASVQPCPDEPQGTDGTVPAPPIK